MTRNGKIGLKLTHKYSGFVLQWPYKQNPRKVRDGNERKLEIFSRNLNLNKWLNVLLKLPAKNVNHSATSYDDPE